MALREEYEATGGWLFRWRSYVPLVMLAITAFALSDFRYLGGSPTTNEYWEIACFVIALLGLGVRIYTIGHTPKGTSGRNTQKQQADTLNTSGIYSTVRHPLYFGNFLIWFGVSLLPHIWWLVIINTLIFWVYYERIMFAEEAFLRGKFGNDYDEWAARTPAFLPRLATFQRSTLPFSVKNVLRREFNSFFGIVVTMFLIDTGCNRVALDEWYVDPLWRELLLLGFLLWLVLRTLKNHTSLLDVEGR